jgi:GMP synthase-like glutamine amidotransferase
MHKIPHIKQKYSNIQSPQHFADILQKNNIDKAIIAGSKQRILQLPHNLCYLDALIANPAIKRIIGICFGWQYFAKTHGGKLVEGTHINKGYTVTGFNIPLWFNHYDSVVSMPTDWIIHDKKPNTQVITAASSKSGRLIGFQFHPEKHTETFKLFMLPFLYGAT